MNNIYLTKTEAFGYTKHIKSVDHISCEWLEKWVEKYQLKKNETHDFSFELEGSRYRVHLFHSFQGWAAALRLLPSEIRDFSELGLGEETILSVCRGTGLTLFCGATGAGKSTTMNAVVDSLLRTNELGVAITIEDPIEYVHNKATIFQREVGIDVDSFKEGLIGAVRSTPRTIVIGEIRDSATALEALKAGLSGHRVFATLHASSVKEAISRLWSLLDSQADDLLVQSLQGVIAQHLIYTTHKEIHCVYETLKVDSKIRNILTQAIDPSSPLSINACDFNQKGRRTLIQHKKELIQAGVDARLFHSIGTYQ